MTGSEWLRLRATRWPRGPARRKAMERRIARKAAALTADEARRLLESFGGPFGPGSKDLQRAWVGCWSQSLDSHLRYHLGRRLLR